MPNCLVPAAAVIAAALAPAGVLAQQYVSQEGASSVPNYSLVQLSVDPDKVSAEAFKAQVDTIRSCEDAVKVGGALGADITRNAYLRGSQLPTDLASILKTLPAGQPTPLFSGKDGQLRVLVICGRT